MALIASLALATATSCGNSSNKLEGSLSDVYNLDFDTVNAQLVGGYLVIEYVRAAGGGKTLKISVDLTGYTVSPGAAISLTEKGAAGGPRGTVQRIVESNVDLPLMSGSLTLDAMPAAGMPLGGSFSAAFTMPVGRAVRGEFRVDKVGQP